MRKSQIFEKIDKLTNSIENAATGEVFDTEFHRINSSDKKQIKKKDWVFDWQREIVKNTMEVYKLTIKDKPDIIQGLLGIEDKHDHVFMHLVESAKFNRGKDRLYLGVAGNLVAYACNLSAQKGYGGFVAFDAKSALIKHYERTIGAFHIRKLRMILNSEAASKLISQYFNS